MPDGISTATGPKGFECQGCDTAGNPCGSNAEMWEAELGGTEEESSTEHWYDKSSSYWVKQDATVNGMLGGLDVLHDRDIEASGKFLAKLERQHGLNMKGTCVLDVGAGIGRITRALLLPRFKVADMLEQNKAYLDESVNYISKVQDGRSAQKLGTIENRFGCGMQEFRVTDKVRGRYHLVWIQWCIIYLTDNDLVEFIKRCLECLAPGGILCVKDNIAPRGRVGYVLDKEDSSIMRGDSYMKNIFSRAGASVIAQSTQADFPSNMYPVKAWALVTANTGKPSPAVEKSLANGESVLEMGSSADNAKKASPSTEDTESARIKRRRLRSSTG